MNKPSEWLSKKLPYTYDFRWLCLYGAGFAALAGLFHTVGVNGWYSRLPWLVTLLFFAFLVGVFFLEVVSKVFPLFKPLLKILSSIIKTFSKVYVYCLAIFLRPIIEYVMEEKTAKDSTYILKRLPGHDDFYLDETFNFEKIRSLKVKLSSNSAYWRFGMKFSEQPAFAEPRLSQKHPLYHLAKDEQNNIVYRVYFDENSNQRQNENIIENYDGSPIILEIDKKDGLRIVTKNAQGEELRSEKFPLALHKYGKLFAWGDRRDYIISVNIEKRKDKN